jgi:hypothetical protein
MEIFFVVTFVDRQSPYQSHVETGTGLVSLQYTVNGRVPFRFVDPLGCEQVNDGGTRYVTFT